jgi:hypothetical protein
MLRFKVNEMALIAEHNCGVEGCEGYRAIGSIITILDVGPFELHAEGQTLRMDYRTTFPDTLSIPIDEDKDEMCWYVQDHELRKLGDSDTKESVTTEESISA